MEGRTCHRQPWRLLHLAVLLLLTSTASPTSGPSSTATRGTPPQQPPHTLRWYGDMQHVRIYAPIADNSRDDDSPGLGLEELSPSHFMRGCCHVQSSGVRYTCLEESSFEYPPKQGTQQPRRQHGDGESTPSSSRKPNSSSSKAMECIRIHKKRGKALVECLGRPSHATPQVHNGIDAAKLTSVPVELEAYDGSARDSVWSSVALMTVTCPAIRNRHGE